MEAESETEMDAENAPLQVPTRAPGGVMGGGIGGGIGGVACSPPSSFVLHKQERYQRGTTLVHPLTHTP